MPLTLERWDREEEEEEVEVEEGGFGCRCGGFTSTLSFWYLLVSQLEVGNLKATTQMVYGRWLNNFKKN